jgi:hypothetical protein
VGTPERHKCILKTACVKANRRGAHPECHVRLRFSRLDHHGLRVLSGFFAIPEVRGPFLLTRARDHNWSKTSPPFPLRYVEHVEGTGTALFRRVCKLDLEGIVTKHKFTPYVTDRENSTWFKILNREYSQKEGREELFERERHSEPVAGWHSCVLACASLEGVNNRGGGSWVTRLSTSVDFQNHTP